MKYYCLGLKLDDSYMEVVCPVRGKCPYYNYTPLGVKLSHPEQYSELDTYNIEKCKYFKEEWQQSNSCETSDAQTDGMWSLLKSVSSK